MLALNYPINFLVKDEREAAFISLVFFLIDFLQLVAMIGEIQRSGDSAMFKQKFYVLIVAVVIAVAVVFTTHGANTSTSAPIITELARVNPITSEEYPRTIEASGPLKAQSYAGLVWKTSGTVEKVNVKTGEYVYAGDILMELQIDSVSADIIVAQADLVEAKQSLEDIQKSNLPLANAQQELANARETLDDKQDDYDRLLRPRVSDEVIDDTADDLETAQDKLKNITWAFNKFFNYEKMDSSRKAKSELSLVLIQAQEDVDTLISKYNWYTSKPDETDIAQTKAALALATARVADAQREVERLTGGPNQDDIASAQATLDAKQSTVNLLYIIAPFDGEVLAIKQNSGNTISAGTTALLLANCSHLYVDAQVVETDIALIQVGDSANVTLVAIPGKVFTGHVTMIEPVGKSVSGLIKYTVRIDLDEVGDESLFLGGTADVTVQINESH